MVIDRAKAIISFAIPFAFAACELKSPDSLMDKVPAPLLLSFAINGTPATISGTNVSFSFSRKWGPSFSVNNVAATFSAVAKSIKVDGVEQTSGITLNDFSSAKKYVLTGLDGSIITYTVNGVSLALFPFADTGQTQCSSTATGDGAMAACPQMVNGQDGDYSNVPTARAFTGPTQHPTYTADYTTTDNITTLIWRTCSIGQSGPTCATGSATALARDNVGTDDASNACTALNSSNSGAGYAGQKDWRLPSVEELSTLLNPGAGAIYIDTVHFPSTAGAVYWTGSTYKPSPTTAWAVTFNTAAITSQALTTTSRVRCVSARAAQYNPPRTDLGNSTIRDESTNLVWQKCSRGQNADASCSGTATTTDWTTSLSYCASLALAGRSWRLPNFRELQSLADVTTASPAISATTFPATQSGSFWSSTTSPLSSISAYRIDFTDGSIGTNAKGSALYARCVSGP